MQSVPAGIRRHNFRPKESCRRSGGDILKATDPERENDLCPDCREDMGIFTLLGFGK